MKFFDNSSVLVHNAMLLLGGVPKRSTGADCKSAGFAFVGSNPTPSTVTKITVEENGAGVERQQCWETGNYKQIMFA